MTLDLILIDDLHNLAYDYYVCKPKFKQEIDRTAMDKVFTQDADHRKLYESIYEAFKSHYYKEIYEGQLEIAFVELEQK